jgi:hypothetical protein
MLNAEDDVKELDNGALCVASTAELDVGLLTRAIVENNTIGKSRIFHVLAAGEERSNSMVEHMRVTALVHAFEKRAYLV